MNRSGTRWWFGAHLGEVKRAWGPGGKGGRVGQGNWGSRG